MTTLTTHFLKNSRIGSGTVAKEVKYDEKCQIVANGLKNSLFIIRFYCFWWSLVVFWRFLDDFRRYSIVFDGLERLRRYLKFFDGILRLLKACESI